MNRIILAIGAVFLSFGVFGATEVDRVREVLEKRFPGIDIQRIAPSPIAGVVEVGLKNQVVYVSGDGRFLLNGKLIDLETGRDLSEVYLTKSRLAAIDAYPESKMIVFEAEGEAKHTITTFTDIDCPYCRKMHEEMADLNAHGIRVRYLLYPRSGVATPSYDKAVSVWCAEDQQNEMTMAKSGMVPDKRDCDHPVDEQMALARELGLTGTPMTITDTGERIMGYVRSSELVSKLDEAKRKVAATGN